MPNLEPDKWYDVTWRTESQDGIRKTYTRIGWLTSVRDWRTLWLWRRPIYKTYESASQEPNPKWPR